MPSNRSSTPSHTATMSRLGRSLSCDSTTSYLARQDPLPPYDGERAPRYQGRPNPRGESLGVIVPTLSYHSWKDASNTTTPSSFSPSSPPKKHSLFAALFSHSSSSEKTLSKPKTRPPRPVSARSAYCELAMALAPTDGNQPQVKGIKETSQK